MPKGDNFKQDENAKKGQFVLKGDNLPPLRERNPNYSVSGFDPKKRLFLGEK